MVKNFDEVKVLVGGKEVDKYVLSVLTDDGDTTEVTGKIKNVSVVEVEAIIKSLEREVKRKKTKDEAEQREIEKMIESMSEKEAFFFLLDKIKELI